jgi:hypothetical protein
LWNEFFFLVPSHFPHFLLLKTEIQSLLSTLRRKTVT